jgi:hypothetical protein
MATGQGASDTEGLIQYFYFILMKLNVYLTCHMWIVATVFFSAL